MEGETGLCPMTPSVWAADEGGMKPIPGVILGAEIHHPHLSPRISRTVRRSGLTMRDRRARPVMVGRVRRFSMTVRDNRVRSIATGDSMRLFSERHTVLTPTTRSEEALATPPVPPAGSKPSLELCFLGLGLVVALSTSASLFTGATPVLADLVSPSWLTNAVRIVVYLVVAFAAGHARVSCSRALLGWGSGICAAVGVLCALIAPVVGEAASVMHLVGVSIMAVGHAVLYLVWLELYARMDLPHVLLYFSLAHLISAALSFVLMLVAAPWFVVGVLVALPLVSAWMLAHSVQRSSAIAFMQGEAPVSGWSLPIKPVVLLASFTFANSFVRHFLTVDLRGMALLGVIAAACLVLALRPRLNKNGIQPLYALSFPLVIAGSLCVLVALPGFGTAGALLTNAAYTLFSIFVTVLLCSVSYRYGVNALWLFGYAQAAVAVGSFGANLLGSQVDFVAHDPALLTLTVALVVVGFSCLYVTFGTDRDRAEEWGITQTAGSERPGPINLDEQCARLARQYGLTRREEEVALRLVQGAPFTQIEADLCVSNSTLKTHARHIYAKADVAGRKELDELVRGL